MQTSEFSWQGTQNQSIFAREWKPDTSPPHAVVALVHGLGEHGNRYQHVAEAFTQAGYAMLSFDLPGHGRSEGKRGHSSFNDIMLEIDHLLAECTRRYPNTPRFLYGHSLGGELVLYHLLKCKPDLTGAIVTSPGINPGTPVARYKVALSRMLYNLMPSFTQPNGLELANLSRDAEVVRAYQADPLVHEQISVRLGGDLLQKGSWILEHATELSVPLLLIQGTADRLVSVDATCRFAECVPRLTTLKLWDGLYHETHNEPEKQEVIAFTLSWIASRLKPSA